MIGSVAAVHKVVDESGCVPQTKVHPYGHGIGNPLENPGAGACESFTVRVGIGIVDKVGESHGSCLCLDEAWVATGFG